MAQQGGGGQTQGASNDQAMNLLWFIVIIIGALLLIWWKKRGLIVTPIFFLRVMEMHIIYWVAAGWDKLATLLPFLHLPHANLQELANVQNYMASTPSYQVNYADFVEVNKTVGTWMKIPTLVTLCSLAIFAYIRHGASLFSKTYSMQRLKETESQNWPQITPVLSLDLLKEDLDKGPWAMAQLPLDFCKQHQLLTVGEENDKSIWQIMPGKAHRILAMQLGPMWRGVDALPIHVKALVVICIARVLRETEVADHYLTQISRSAASGQLNFAGVNEQLKKYKKAKVLLWTAKRHAYVSTVLATLLESARAYGVLATAEFLWLKPVDRRLWYMLNSVGRNTSVVEVSGLFAHWLAEKKLKRRMKTPLVKEAVNALEFAVKDVLHIGDGESWHTYEAATA